MTAVCKVTKCVTVKIYVIMVNFENGESRENGMNISLVKAKQSLNYISLVKAMIIDHVYITCEVVAF